MSKMLDRHSHSKILFVGGTGLILLAFFLFLFSQAFISCSSYDNYCSMKTQDSFVKLFGGILVGVMVCLLSLTIWFRDSLHHDRFLPRRKS